MIVEVYVALIYISAILMIISFLSVKVNYSLPMASWLSVIFLGALAFSSATVENKYCEYITDAWQCTSYASEEIGNIWLFGSLCLFMLIYSILAQFVWVEEEIKKN